MVRTDEMYHFTESGLSNLYLQGFPAHKCPNCGERSVEIQGMSKLLEFIAENLVQKDSILTGEEIRFLRKSLGFKGVEFASRLAISPEHLSRVENGSEPVSKQIDHMTRFIYALSKDPLRVKGQELVSLVARVSDEAENPNRLISSTIAGRWEMAALAS